MENENENAKKYIYIIKSQKHLKISIILMKNEEMQPFFYCCSELESVLNLLRLQWREEKRGDKGY